LPIAKEGQMTVTGADGLDYIVVSHYSDKAGWYVVGTAPVHELIKDTQVIRALLGWIVAAATVFAVLLSVLVARSMGGPLRKLQALMMEGASGNLNVRTSFKNRDEIGQVGRSFNEMMEQIRSLVQQTNQSASDVLGTAQDLTGSAKIGRATCSERMETAEGGAGSKERGGSERRA